MNAKGRVAQVFGYVFGVIYLKDRLEDGKFDWGGIKNEKIPTQTQGYRNDMNSKLEIFDNINNNLKTNNLELMNAIS